MPIYYMSFADDGRFLGACVVEAVNVEAAVSRTWKVGCNPGGEIAIVELDAGETLAIEWRDRLLSREEAENLPEPTRADKTDGR